MLPQENNVKLIGSFTGEEFTSLIITQEHTPSLQDVRISQEARDSLPFGDLMDPTKDRTRNLKLLMFMNKEISWNWTPKKPDEKKKLRQIIAIFEMQLQPNDPASSGLIRQLRMKTALTKDEIEKEAEEVDTRITSGTEPSKYLPQAFPILTTKAFTGFRTLTARYFGTPNKEAFDHYAANKHKVHQDYYSMIERLLTPGTFLSGYDIKCILKMFSETYNEPSKKVLDYLRQGVNTHNAQTVAGREPSVAVEKYLKDTKAEDVPNFLFFPFNYAGSWTSLDTSHIVMIAIDFARKEVIYYDSQGRTPDQRKIYSNFDMGLELEALRMICFGKDPEAKIKVPEFVHQQDSHNCGVCVLHFAESLVKGESFEIFQKRTITHEEIERTRANYAMRATEHFSYQS